MTITTDCFNYILETSSLERRFESCSLSERNSRLTNVAAHIQVSNEELLMLVHRALQKFKTTKDKSKLDENLKKLFTLHTIDGNSLVHVCVMFQEQDLLKLLISILPDDIAQIIDDVNDDDKTGLDMAVEVGDCDMLELLLVSGVDLSTSLALHDAASKNNTAAISLIVKHSPQHMNTFNDKGLSPLHVAVDCGCEDAVSELCNLGADVNIECKTQGRTPLHLAAAHGNYNIAQILINQEEIDWEAENFSGETAYDVASQSDHKEISQLIQDMQNKYPAKTETRTSPDGDKGEVYV
jgi:hypothetical protein